MGAGVVTIGRREYAVGLYWENSPGGRIAQTAKEAARQPGQQADFYAIRPGNKSGRVPQFGLSQASAGHKSGMAAFAGCLANQQPGSWAGAFRLREGVVVTVVRDDLIVPDGDQFFLNESEARDKLLQEIGFGGLQRVFAPESWAISGSDTMPVSLLMDERRDIRLYPVAVSKKTLLIGAAAAGILLLLLGGGWYYQEQKAEEEAARQAQEDALRRLSEQAKKGNPFSAQQPQYPPPERRWEKHPQPLEVIESCRVALTQVPAEVAGWNFSTLRCTEASLSAEWSRGKGMSRPPEGAVLDDTGARAVLNLPLPALAVRGAEALVDPNVVLHRYLAQDWPGRLTAAPDDPPPLPPPGFQGNWNPPPPPWVKRSFTLTVTELPASLPHYLEDLPGIVVENLSYTSGTWSVTGVIYENRI